MNIEEAKFAQLRRRILKRKFQVAKNQAHFRDQVWDITESEYFDLWESVPQAWLDSGTGSKNWNLSRVDMDGGWTLDNVHLVQRRDMLAAEGRCVRLRNARKRS